MLKNSDTESDKSDREDRGSDGEEQGESFRLSRPVLREARLVQTGPPVEPQKPMADGQRQAEEEFARYAEQQAAKLAQLQAVIAEQERKIQGKTMVEATANLEWEKLQAAICANIAQDIATVEKFCGDVGDLNHFLRSGERIIQRIAERESDGRLYRLDAESLRGAWNRRVHRSILNQLQADETTPWEELRVRLQKEFGGGRWTPEEDTIRMLRLTRRTGQSKGDFVAQLLTCYQGVVDKYRETLTGPEATACLGVVERLAKAQLGEAVGKTISGSFTAEAHAIIDAAGRGEEDDEREWRRVTRGWRPGYPRQEGQPRRREEGRSRRREDRRRDDRPRASERPQGVARGNRPADGRRCFACGKSGHLQAKCAAVSCYQCGNRGHLARNCPHRPPPRRNMGEPMEVNVHRPRRIRSRPAPESESRSSDGEGSDGGTTSDSTASITTYAAVVKKKRTGEPAHPKVKRVTGAP